MMSRCCIVGGGPAGMMLGLLLSRAGVPVTVLEKHRDFLRDFRGDTVHPSTLRLLDELGLGERFASLDAVRMKRMRMLIGENLVTAADFSRLPGKHKYVAMVPQWDFLSLLAEVACEEPSFELRMSSDVAGLHRDADGRVVGVAYRDESGEAHCLEADVVIGCDGRDSVIRRDAGLSLQTIPTPMDVWSIRVPKSGRTDHDETVFARFDRGFAAVSMDRGSYFQIAYLIEKGTDVQRRALDIDHFRRELTRRFGWTAEQSSALTTWGDVKLLEVQMGYLDTWHVENILCIGDAAHPMSPVGGVGVNLAIQDAVAAATVLADPLRRGVIAAQDLQKVQRRRAAPMKAVQRSQQGEHKMLIEPALSRTLDRHKPPSLFRLLARLPALQFITAYIGGFGLRPEHAPTFARR